MPSRDLVHSVAAAQSIAPATVGSSTTVNGVNSLDTFGYESITILAIVGARTDGTYAFKVQDSADGTTDFTDIDLTSYIGGALPASMVLAGVAVFGLKDNSAAAPARPSVRRYVRVVVTSTAVTTGATGVGALVLLGHPRHRQAAV